FIGDFEAVVDAWRRRGQQVTVVRLDRPSLGESVAGRWQNLHGDADAVFVGLRADESRARGLTLRHHGTIHQPAEGPLRICPIAWFGVRDVGALIALHDLPVLAAYDHGLELRTTSRVPREAWGIRGRFLDELHERDPANWARLRARWPE